MTEEIAELLAIEMVARRAARLSSWIGWVAVFSSVALEHRIAVSAIEAAFGDWN